MSHAFSTLPAAAPHFFSWAGLRLPVFGAVTTAGLVAALLLSRRTAPLAGLAPEPLWNAGMMAVLGAFVISRALLVAVNLRLFLHSPMLVLLQPSLTPGGLVLTALPVWFSLRRRGLPIRRVLDAWAAPAALLLAAGALGRFAEGAGGGMPTTLPWGLGHATSAIRLHPVAIYSAVAELLLAGGLFLHLRTGRAAERASGATAAYGLAGWGFLLFSIGFFQQPAAPFSQAWLDPSQYAALAAMLAGLGLWLTVTRRRDAQPAEPYPAVPLPLHGEPR